MFYHNFSLYYWIFSVLFLYFTVVTDSEWKIKQEIPLIQEDISWSLWILLMKGGKREKKEKKNKKRNREERMTNKMDKQTGN